MRGEGLTIACVLRSGGKVYDARWVERLRRNVARHAPPHRFVCLSDVDVPCERVPLAMGWPGWWSILEVFRPRLFTGRVVYFDLANLIVDAIAPFTEGEGFVIAPDPYNVGPGKFASGVMAFDAGDTEIFDRFDPSTIGRLHGDQEWIMEFRPRAATFAPGLAVSYKGQCRGHGRYPTGAVAVLCHGKPKPDAIDDAWVRDMWTRDWPV